MTDSSLESLQARRSRRWDRRRRGWRNDIRDDRIFSIAMGCAPTGDSRLSRDGGRQRRARRRHARDYALRLLAAER